MSDPASTPAPRTRGPMTGDEFGACLDAIDWTHRGLADRLEVGESSVRQWRRDRRPIPEPVATWLRKLARFHLANPPPAAPDGAAARGRGRPPGGTIWPASGA